MVIIFPYAEREPRETWLTWLVWGTILGMNPHLGVTNTNLEKQLVCVRIFCKITLYWLCGLQILRSKRALTLFLGRVWSRQNTALPHEKEGNQLFYLFSSRLWAVMPWRGTICLSLALNQLSFPLTIIIILNQHCRGSPSRYCVRTGKPSALSKQGEQWRCQVSQGWWWLLPKLNSPRGQTLGNCLRPKVKIVHVFRGAIFPHPIHSMPCFKGDLLPYTYLSTFLHHPLCFCLPPLILIPCLTFLPRMADTPGKVIFPCCGA